MGIISIRLILSAGIAALLCVQGCALEKDRLPAQRTQRPADSLYEKYGGAPAVKKVVQEVVVTLIADCTQNPYFTTVLNTPGHDSTDRLQSCLELQFTALLGGPGKYPGRARSWAEPTQSYECADLKSIHEGLGISSQVFDRFVVDVAGVLKSSGFSDVDIARIAPAMIGRKDEVVAPDGFEVQYRYTPDQPPGNGCAPERM